MSARLSSLKPTQVIRILRQLGYVEERQSGSHKIFVGPVGPDRDRTVVVPFHNRDLKRGTLVAIIKATGLTVQDFLARR